MKYAKDISPEDIANYIFDHEDGIPIKKEIKQEIKTEPMDGVEKVQDKSNRDTLNRAEDITNFIFDHEDGIPIKKEMKREIKTELMDGAEKVQEKSNSNTLKPEPVDGAEKVLKESNSDTLKRAGDIANFIGMGTIEDQSKTRRAWISSGLTFEIFQNIQALAPFRINDLISKAKDPRPRIIPVKNLKYRKIIF